MIVMTENIKAFKARIARASTPSDFDKLEASLTRLYENGIFSVQQFSALDILLIDTRIEKEQNQ
jgi:uncharacterized protein YqgQ